jgi:hypothetical protein
MICQEPRILRSGRYGCSAECCCGWRSPGRWRTAWGASLDWARHIAEEVRRGRA